MTALWTSADLVTATIGAATRPFEASDVSIDTRTLEPGALFVAIRGDSRDGHEFVRAALEAKAAAAIVSRIPREMPSDAPLLVVGNTQRALEDMARAARSRTRAEIVAVTGSVGKTTTKELLRCALSALGHTSASAASFNNHWGVPLSLAAMPLETKYGVFEIGMNHFGEIRTLAGQVRPHVAIVTTIAEAHIEFFGNCDSIADAKSEVFEGLLPGGTALLPSDSPYHERLAARARQAGVPQILKFGMHAESDARLIAHSNSADGLTMEVDIMGHRGSFTVGAPGAHIARNALSALATVAVLGGDIRRAGEALAGFSALKGRGARFDIALPHGRVQVIDESYNANPSSMRAALALLGSSDITNGGRRIAVLGDMLELGEQGERLHTALAPDIEAAHVDSVFACGPQMASLWQALPASRRGAYGQTSNEIAPLLLGSLNGGDVVLVKGSLGSRMAVVIDALKSRDAAV